MRKNRAKIDRWKFYQFRIQFYEKNCNECIHKEKAWGYKSEIVVCGKRNKPMYNFLKDLFIYPKLPYCHIAERLTKEQKIEIAELTEVNNKNNSRPIIKVYSKRFQIDDWIKPQEEFFIYL